MDRVGDDDDHAEVIEVEGCGVQSRDKTLNDSGPSEQR
jgi:hypothetical protein